MRVTVRLATRRGFIALQQITVITITFIKCNKTTLVGDIIMRTYCLLIDHQSGNLVVVVVTIALYLNLVSAQRPGCRFHNISLAPEDTQGEKKVYANDFTI
jgi:hypothetical protein